jgi:uncharacterized protein YceH (UPF0502 family)
MNECNRKLAMLAASGGLLVAEALAAHPGHPTVEAERPTVSRPLSVPAPDADVRALLKEYEALWVTADGDIDPDTASLQASEQRALAALDALAPQALVALLIEGQGPRSTHLVALAVGNAARGLRRAGYEQALVQGIGAVRGRPDRLALLSALLLKLGPSPQSAGAAAELLMSGKPEGALADRLGALAARLEGPARNKVKRYAAERRLVETLGHLVDSAADVDRLMSYLDSPATRARAGRALATASPAVANPDLRRRIERALEK